jgi:DNA-binding helix-hairpin-helix protein with protein kinase domain
MLSGLRIDNQPLQPAKRIGKGGEGEVWSLANDPKHAIKLYTIPNPGSLESKVRAMVAAQLAQKASQVAFPVAVVTRDDGRFAGFLMRLVQEHKPVHELYAPGSRKAHFPKAGYQFLVRSALNIARAIGAVHQLGCVIGDINHSSVLVSSGATVVLIDADSFQVKSGSTQYLCRVGVAEYTPPELQGIPLASIVRTSNHDAFGLAVLVFELLFMGRHPFMGTVRKGEPPSLPEAIKQGRFAYSESRDVGMDQPPGTASLSDFPHEISEAFEAAFSQRTSNARPTAAQWISALQVLEKSLMQCDADSLHWYPEQADECPWCYMDKTFGMSVFVPYIPPAKLNDSLFDPGESGFNLEAVWRQIEGTGFLSRAQVSPQLPTSSLDVSSTVRMLRLRRDLSFGLRCAIVVGAIGFWIYAPDYWFLDAVVGGLALFGLAKGRRIDPKPLLTKYEQVDREWSSALSKWYERIELSGPYDLYQSLLGAKKEYENLSKIEAGQRRTYMEQRRARQLHVYLDRFEIRNSKIKGIGPAKLAALLSFGIETAADIQQNRIVGVVPGFGPTNSQALLKWRAAQESRFVYSEQQNDIDRQELSKIRLGIQGKASQLRRTLLAGASNLNALISRTKSLAATKDNQLIRLATARAQLLKDLEAIGISQSTLAKRSASAASIAPSLRVPTPAPAAPASPASIQPRMSCPRCGSAMIRRTARRGARAGRQFWGCSRYPTCTGTRN